MKKKNELLFDMVTFSERLEDLRKGDGKNVIPLQEISDYFKNKMGISLSSMQLSKYENADIQEVPNINNVLALAKYYDVSIDYLLGNTNSKSKNYNEQMTAKKFGLSDEAMKKLAFWVNNNMLGELHLINYILENDLFIKELSENLGKYYNSMKNTMDDKLFKEYGVSAIDINKHNLVRTFENFVDDIYKKECANRKKNYIVDV